MELSEQATIPLEFQNRTVTMIRKVSPELNTTYIKLNHVINT